MTSLDVQSKVLLAPMAGISDPVFRFLCIEAGADFSYTEMVSAKGLEYSSEKTRDLLKLSPNEKKVGVQLFGCDPDSIKSQGVYVEDTLAEKLGCIDVNMGCPARKIVKKGDGSALMKDPKLAASIIKALKESVSVPVTCKFRRGFDIGDDTSLEFARRMEGAGADAVAVHGRYAMQYYRGEADWNCIRIIKENINIPVIGNGDIKSGRDAVSMISQTGCDHVMVARAAEGNPWIFEDIKEAFRDERGYSYPDYETRIDTAIRHARLLAQDPNSNMVRMRKFAAMYIKGIPNASRTRSALNGCIFLDDFVEVLEELKASLHNPESFSSGFEHKGQLHGA